VLLKINYPLHFTGCLDIMVDGERQAFQIANGKAQALVELPTENSIELSIATLTRLVLGVADWANEEAGLNAKQRQWLEQCLPPLTTWINEYT
jgi:hypothetical protein